MTEAFAWGLLAGSSLLLGGLIALRFDLSRNLVGLVMAFGSGVLISAVAYELVFEAFETSDGEGGADDAGRHDDARGVRHLVARGAA